MSFGGNLDELDPTIHRLHEGKSLGEPFLALVLLGLVFEVFLANRASALPTAAASPERHPVTPSACPPTTWSRRTRWRSLKQF